MAKSNNATNCKPDTKEIMVRWDKFIDGVGMVFSGVQSMLEALDADTVKCLLEENFQGAGHSSVKEVENASEKTGAGSMASVSDNGTAGMDDPAVATDVKNEPVSGDDAKAEKITSQEETVVQNITLDDLTKVIVQKIKQSRSNNAKIGSILKTYGVAKVSELPAEKYEAFLTDIAQL